MKHLKLWMSRESNADHPLDYMKKLGITFQHATPQSIGEQWWFWNCENIPDVLPKDLEDLDIDPMNCIGFGLDEKSAIRIRDYRPVDSHIIKLVKMTFGEEASKNHDILMIYRDCLNLAVEENYPKPEPQPIEKLFEMHPDIDNIEIWVKLKKKDIIHSIYDPYRQRLYISGGIVLSKGEIMYACESFIIGEIPKF